MASRPIPAPSSRRRVTDSVAGRRLVRPDGNAVTHRGGPSPEHDGTQRTPNATAFPGGAIPRAARRRRPSSATTSGRGGRTRRVTCRRSLPNSSHEALGAGAWRIRHAWRGEGCTGGGRAASCDELGVSSDAKRAQDLCGRDVRRLVGAGGEGRHPVAGPDSPAVAGPDSPPGRPSRPDAQPALRARLGRCSGVVRWADASAPGTTAAPGSLRTPATERDRMGFPSSSDPVAWSVRSVGTLVAAEYRPPRSLPHRVEPPRAGYTTPRRRNPRTASDQRSMCSGSPKETRFHSSIGGKGRPTRMPCSSMAAL